MERLTNGWGARARRGRWSGVVVGMLLVALGAGARPAAAQTIIGNLPGDDGTYTFLTNTSMKAAGFAVGASPYTLTGATLRLKVVDQSVPVVQLRADFGGNPGAVLTSFTNPSFTPDEIGNYTFSPNAAVTLQANTKYWLSAGEPTGRILEWYASNPGVDPTGPGATTIGYRNLPDSSASWENSILYKNAYAILGTPVGASDTPAVPEPSAALLFLPALGVVAFARRKR